MKYKSKPITVDAFRFGYEAYPKWFKEKKEQGGINVFTNCIKFESEEQFRTLVSMKD